jgi:hypothetical protein
VLGGDARFGVKARECIAVPRTLEPAGPLSQLFRIPAAAVLLFQQQQSTGRILARRQARGVEVHQREQGKGRRRRAHWVTGQQGPEANGLVA